MILPTEIFHGPQFASLNVHASLLPRWRGAAPIERAIMAGDSETGVSIMQIEKALDAGPLFALTHHPLSGDETGASLSKTLARIGSASLIEVLRDWSDLPKPSPQDHQRATYAYKLTPADSLISWTTPAVDIERIVRALSDRSAAYTTLGDNRIRILKVKVLEGSANPGELVKTNEGFAIGCADGLLLLDTVQLNRGQGKPMSADDAANGHADLFSTGIQYDVVG
jgi:methionyl-tRNA formyltransferase